ncbi:hypothetical protein IAE16_01430 [Hydrogenobacter sp. T-2]|uniref:hypothetical protein n=1 Tax=Pampinifervens diazotrophicum TaxID=1632018 RepID=UPI002B25FD4A|nr:hypothetical protein [Hydrogenobacter sp. T-2]WPM32352.1 hypothetical protein IAE16_01430 [Hydrogenobacter sp. T-2]
MEQLELQKSYQIRNFYDLLQALREHPEWLEELRTLILTADLIELPKKFDRFVKERFEPLEEKVAKIQEDVEAVKQTTARTEKRVEVLEKDVAWLKKEVKSLKVDVASLKGDNLERKVREKAPAYFGRFFRKIKVIDIQQWAEKLDDAEEQGLITPEEREKALNLDILLRAKKGEKEFLLAVEVSYTVDEKDALRALERANIFYKLYQIETIPVVIGVEIPPELEERHKEVLFTRVVQEQNPS